MEGWYTDESCYQSSTHSLPLPCFHLPVLIIDHNSTVHMGLEVGVSVGYQLQLKTIIDTLEKTTLLLSIVCHLIRSITRQLSKLVTVLAHSH